MSVFNLGDALFQLLMLGVLIITIVLIVRLFRSFSKRKDQLDNIEKKLDVINEQIKRDKN